jgi:hypothetical protein
MTRQIIPIMTTIYVSRLTHPLNIRWYINSCGVGIPARAITHPTTYLRKYKKPSILKIPGLLMPINQFFQKIDTKQLLAASS